MPTLKPDTKKQTPSLVKPLIIAAAVVIVIGLCVLIAGKAQRSDPTLTAAPPSGNPGQPVLQASPEKMARQQQIRARMDAELGPGKAAPH